VQAKIYSRLLELYEHWQCTTLFFVRTFDSKFRRTNFMLWFSNAYTRTIRHQLLCRLCYCMHVVQKTHDCNNKHFHGSYGLCVHLLGLDPYRRHENKFTLFSSPRYGSNPSKRTQNPCETNVPKWNFWDLEILSCPVYEYYFIN